MLVKKIFSELLCFGGWGGGDTLDQKIVYKNVLVYLSTGIKAILLLNRVISHLFAKHFYFRSE